jgi:hypothetical protein
MLPIVGLIKRIKKVHQNMSAIARYLRWLILNSSTHLADKMHFADSLWIGLVNEICKKNLSIIDKT